MLCNRRYNGPIGVVSNVFTNTFPVSFSWSTGLSCCRPRGIPAGVLTTFTVGDWVKTYAQSLYNAVLGPTPPTNGPYSHCPHVSRAAAQSHRFYRLTWL